MKRTWRPPPGGTREEPVYGPALRPCAVALSFALAGCAVALVPRAGSPTGGSALAAGAAAAPTLVAPTPGASTPGASLSPRGSGAGAELPGVAESPAPLPVPVPDGSDLPPAGTSAPSPAATPAPSPAATPAPSPAGTFTSPVPTPGPTLAATPPPTPYPTPTPVPPPTGLSLSVRVTTLAGAGGIGYQDGPGSEARFRVPYGIALDPLGNLVLADMLDGRLRQISPAGDVTTLAGSGIAGLLDGQAGQARFYFPSGVAVDKAGNVFVADQENHAVRRLAAGVVSTVAGNGERGHVDARGGAARFSHPTGIAIDDAGTLYVSEFSGHRLRKISAGGDVTTLAGGASHGFADGAGDSARFFGPAGLAVDAAGNVYVADQLNHAVRKVTPAGLVSTVAGTGAPGFRDGPASQAMFNGPLGVAMLPTGAIVVADYDGYRIRVIHPDGDVENMAGTGVEAHLDGVGAQAGFHHPAAVAVDGAGNVYVADQHSNRIRQIGPIGGQ